MPVSSTRLEIRAACTARRRSRPAMRPQRPPRCGYAIAAEAAAPAQGFRSGSPRQPMMAEASAGIGPPNGSGAQENRTRPMSPTPRPAYYPRRELDAPHTPRNQPTGHPAVEGAFAHGLRAASTTPTRPTRRYESDGARMGSDVRGTAWRVVEGAICPRRPKSLLFGLFRVPMWRIVGALAWPLTSEIFARESLVPCREIGASR